MKLKAFLFRCVIYLAIAVYIVSRPSDWLPLGGFNFWLAVFAFSLTMMGIDIIGSLNCRGSASANGDDSKKLPAYTTEEKARTLLMLYIVLSAMAVVAVLAILWNIQGSRPRILPRHYNRTTFRSSSPCSTLANQAHHLSSAAALSFMRCDLS